MTHAAHSAAADPAHALPRLAAQWTGVLLAPATFFAHLQIGYVLVERACRYHATEWLHVAGLASVVLAAAGTWVAWQVWRRTDADAAPEGDARARARFLGVTGLGVGALLTLILLAQWLAVFFVSPCQ